MIVHVALPIPVRKAFSYTVPDTWVPFIGLLLRVKVPFKNRDAVGFIVGIDKGDAKNLKEIQEIVDPFPLLDEKTLRLAEWACHYYIAPKGLVLGYALPSGFPIEQYVKIRALSETDTLNNLRLRKAYRVFGREVVYNHYSKDFLRLYDIFTNKDFLPFNHEQLNSTGEKTLFLPTIFMMIVSSITVRQSLNILLETKMFSCLYQTTIQSASFILTSSPRGVLLREGDSLWSFK